MLEGWETEESDDYGIESEEEEKNSKKKTMEITLDALSGARTKEEFCKNS